MLSLLPIAVDQHRAKAMPPPPTDEYQGYIQQPASDDFRESNLGGENPTQNREREAAGALTVPEPPRPSKKNYLPRIWSVGGRAGSYGNTGLLAQYVGSGEVAWNIGINVMDSSGALGLGLTFERIMLFDESFNELTWPNLQRWIDSRGHLVYYTGFGVKMDGLGLYPQIPVGVQFTMTADPATWFGQITVAYGPALGATSTASLKISPELGVRYVLD